MTRRVRSKELWPKIDRDAEKFVKDCRDCILVFLPDNPVPMRRYAFPSSPWDG